MTTSNTSRTVRLHGRILSQQLGIPYQAANRVVGLNDRVVRDLHASQAMSELNAERELTAAHRVEDGLYATRASKDASTRRLVSCLGADFLAQLDDLETVIVPAVDEFVARFAGLRPSPEHLALAHRLWTPVRAIALATATQRGELRRLWTAQLRSPARPADALAEACLALCRLTGELVRSTEQFSDRVLLPFSATISAHDYDDGDVFGCWRALEGQLEAMWHCTRRLEAEAKGSVGADMRWPETRLYFRLITRDELIATSSDRWRAQDRRADHRAQTGVLVSWRR
jgi:hypothetical protein